MVADEVVEVVPRAPEPELFARSKPIGAKGDDEGRLKNERLAEVQLAKMRLPFDVSGQDHRDTVEVAGGRAPGDSVDADPVNQGGVDGGGFVFADRPMRIEEFGEFDGRSLPMHSATLERMTSGAKQRAGRNLVGYLFISPWLIGFAAFTAGPFLRSIYLSFTRYNIVTEPKWVGLANYRMLLTQDELFWKSAFVTIKYAAISVPLAIVFGIMLALLLNANVKGIAFFRTIFYLPSIVPTVATAVIFIWILNPKIGLINQLLGLIHIHGKPLQGPSWLNTTPWAFYSLVFMALWGVGGSMIIYLAGLKDIPTHLYEAATIDGANGFRKLRHITLPMMTPVIFFNLVMGIIGAFQVFTQAYVITPDGGPEQSTYFYSLYLYNRAWKYLDMGYASAMAWILFLVIVVMTAVVFRTRTRWVHYGG